MIELPYPLCNPHFFSILVSLSSEWIKQVLVIFSFCFVGLNKWWGSDITSVSHNSFLEFRFTRLLVQQAGNGHFDIVLCSSHISITRHLIVLLKRGMTLTVSESSFDLYHLHFIPPEKHNKHTLPPFPSCLQHLAVTCVTSTPAFVTFHCSAQSVHFYTSLTYREAFS